MLGVQGDFRLVPWTIVIVIGLMGGACWVQLLPRPPLTLGAIAILVGGFVLFAHTGGTRSFFMPWYLVLVAVYPVVIPEPYRRLLPAAAAGAFALLIPFTDPPAPPELVPTRVFIILLIGYLTLSLADRSDKAEEDAARRLRYEQAVAEATRLLNEGDRQDAIQDALNALRDGTDSRSVFVERNKETPEGISTTVVFESKRPDVEPPGEEFWTDVPWSTMPMARSHLEAGRPFAFKVKDLAGSERQKYEESGIKSEIDLPIFISGHWYGLIGISDDLVERDWGQDDIALLRAAASAIGAFIEREEQRRRLEELAQSRAERIQLEQAIAASARILLMSDDERAIDGTLEALGTVMRAQKVFVDENFVGDDGRLHAKVTHEYIRPEYVSLVDEEIWFDEETGTIQHYEFCYDDSPAIRDLLASGKDAIVYPGEVANAHDLGYGQGEKAELNIPIFSSGRWVGSAVLQDYVEARDWEPDEKRLLHTVAAMIGAFWERNKSRQLLEDLLKSKDEFVASVSHELRTPLTAVVGLAQELRHNGLAFGEDEARELIGLIADQSVDVANIVEDLLVAARAETGALTVIPGEVDLRSEAKAIVAAKTILPANGKSVLIEGEAKAAWADPTRVRQILRNLLTNAVRYGGDSVRITLSSTQTTASISVHDTGDPIPQDAHDRIFKPYQRAHSIPSQPASVGLGLSVSLQLAELMNGSLTYDHTGGESIFTLTLPTARSLSAAV